jgi:cyclohexanone monooxygenase
VHDPETAARLCPSTHPLGTKRLRQDIAYFEAFNDPRVSLVDLTETPIDHIAADGVATSAGSHPLDVLVFATGFDALSGAILKIDITRTDGVRLAEHRADGPRTYLGMAVAGATRAEATRTAEDEWLALSNKNVQATLYPSAASWYMGANVPGKPRVFLPFVGGVNLYRQLCAAVARDGYRGFELSGALSQEERLTVG